MHFAKFQTVFVVQRLEQKRNHQACCIQSTGQGYNRSKKLHVVVVVVVVVVGNKF